METEPLLPIKPSRLANPAALRTLIERAANEHGITLVPVILLDANDRPWIITAPDDPREDHDAWSHETSQDDGLRPLGEVPGPLTVLWPR